MLSAKSNDTIIVKNFQVEFKASYGFIICHHPEMKYFQSHFPIFELSFHQVTTGRKSWQSKSNYPSVGFSFLYTGIGEMPEIGRAFAVFPHIDFNCLKSKRTGYSFSRQKPILNYIADFYCHELRLVVEIDGSTHFDIDEMACINLIN